MKPQPTLQTERLVLRPLTKEDASQVQLLAGDKRIADVTANIPHPYPDELAETWIQTHSKKWEKKELAAFAIEQKDSKKLLGCVSVMHINKSEADLGYWVGVEYWNNGYCTEACKKVLEFCFGYLKLKHIKARHLSRNPASGRVLIKSGLSHIGSEKSECGYRNMLESIELYRISDTHKPESVTSLRHSE